MSDIQVLNLSKSFDGRSVLNGFSATFKDGSTTCIMGVSGRGKTTLLNLISGLLKPDCGTVSGVPENISFVFQEDRLCENFSAEANIRLVTGKTMSSAEILSHLKELGLENSSEQPVRSLSGGMKRRVAIARAICYPSGLLLLDEPFKGLDEALREETIAYIQRHRANRTIICVTHDPLEAKLLNADLIYLEEDKNDEN